MPHVPLILSLSLSPLLSCFPHLLCQVHALNVSPPSLEDRIAELQSIASDHNIHMDLDKAVQAMKMSAGGISTPLIDVSDADVPVSARPNNP